VFFGFFDGLEQGSGGALGGFVGVGEQEQPGNFFETVVCVDVDKCFHAVSFCLIIHLVVSTQDFFRFCFLFKQSGSRITVLTSIGIPLSSSRIHHLS